MDKRVLRERMRRKKRQMMIRRYMKLATYVIGLILAVVFVIRGVIIPIASRVGGGSGGNEGITTEVQAQVAEADPNAAIRQPIKGRNDLGKVTSMTPGWHDDESGRWYQNADSTYYANGFQEIDGETYSFDKNGYLETGWVSRGVKDYYFNDDGSYNPNEKRKMLALTFDDGPSEYTMELLKCLQENGAKATFFMLGEHVDLYPDEIRKMKEIGCELGSHSWDHPDLTTLDLDTVASQFDRVDNALINVCGSPATVARAPYGSGSYDIFETVGKPFIHWSLDTKDWSYLDVDMDYNAVMNGDLTGGSIILMHDIHQPSVQAALRIIPDLVAQGYKLVTVSELAAAKGVKLQYAQYTDFWDSDLAAGNVPGYEGPSDDLVSSGGDAEDFSDDTGDYSDGSYDGSSDNFDDSENDNSGGEFSDDSSDEYTDGEES